MEHRSDFDRWVILHSFHQPSFIHSCDDELTMSELVLYYEGGAAAPEGGARLRNGAGPESTHTTFSLNTNHQTERTTPEEQRRTAMGAPPKRSRAEFWLIQLWYVISLKRSSGRCGQLDRKALERIREVKQRLVPPSHVVVGAAAGVRRQLAHHHPLVRGRVRARARVSS